MRHLVNFGLLATFIALATTGLLAFFRPFSLTVTQVHVVAGFATLALVLLHIASRLPYFRRQLGAKKPDGGKLSRGRLVILLAGTALLFFLAGRSLPPVSWLMDRSYEARHRAEIVRTSSLVGFAKPTPHQKIITRVPETEGSQGLSLHLTFDNELDPLPAVAVWAETATGTMIETLYLQGSLAYSDDPVWAGAKTPRSHILPLWRHRYTAISGIDPDGEVDAVTGATDTHSFALDPYLVAGEGQKFVLCVEVNAAHDPNEAWPEPTIGQPSLLYTALIKIDSEQRYHLLEKTGHGGGAEASGDIHYDLESLTTAENLIDLLLAKLESSGSDSAN